ncbi:unnamed protein product [Dibothriocephalus latus]|uniref:Vacuolar protein 14 C-terminal Fig4-binding domain-containing protein n=1 Tax=Dibothriocephalus latus TaxID=60516 RepID=A0A3P6SQP7_DIBLA|nr:unnamed protein product [Dibothriocephalus latus]
MVHDPCLMDLGHCAEIAALMNFSTPAEDVVFFEQLYRAWCHNPVALLALCLLTQNYSHCRLLIKCLLSSSILSFPNYRCVYLLRGELAVSVEMLVEMDQLIQLIESPVFAKAFETLRRRLQCLPSYTLSDSTRESEQLCANPPGTDFDSLLKHFQAVQKRHSACCLSLYQVTDSDVSAMRAFSPRADVAYPPLAGSNDSGGIQNDSKRIQFSLLPQGSQANSNSTAFLIQALEKLGINVSPPSSQPG